MANNIKKCPQLKLTSFDHSQTIDRVKISTLLDQIAAYQVSIAGNPFITRREAYANDSDNMRAYYFRGC